MVSRLIKLMSTDPKNFTVKLMINRLHKLWFNFFAGSTFIKVALYIYIYFFLMVWYIHFKFLTGKSSTDILSALFQKPNLIC